MKKMVTYRTIIIAEVDETGNAHPLKMSQEILDGEGMMIEESDRPIPNFPGVYLKVLADQVKDIE